jgi:hypothetical protein
MLRRAACAARTCTCIPCAALRAPPCCRRRTNKLMVLETLVNGLLQQRNSEFFYGSLRSA